MLPAGAAGLFSFGWYPLQFDLAKGASSSDRTTLVAPAADEYDFLGVAGRGGHSVVYKAVHRKLQRVVALKMLSPSLTVTDEAVRRFSREARATASLDHPNIVKVFASGLSGEAEPYLVMEYLEGRTLAQMLREDGALSCLDFWQIFSAVLSALNHAHGQGVIHRDLKPGNIMIIEGSQGRKSVKVVDFGIAKLMSEGTGELSVDSLTRPGAMLGSPPYMSPEQCTNGKLDGRSDIYSLGCVMFEALTLRPPLRGGSPLETMFQHLTVTPQSPTQLVPGLILPAGIEQMIARSLEKSPSARQQSASEMKEELEAAFVLQGGQSLPAALQTLLSAALLRRRSTGNRPRLPGGLPCIWARFVSGARRIKLSYLTSLLCVVLMSLVLLIFRQYKSREEFAVVQQHRIAATKFIACASASARKGQSAQAIRYYQLALGALAGHPVPTLLVKAYEGLGRVYNKSNQASQAEHALRLALATARAAPDVDKFAVLEDEYQLAMALTCQAKFAQAAPLCRHVLDGRRRLLGADCRDVEPPMHLLIDIYTAQNKLKEAEKFSRYLIPLHYALYGPLDNTVLWEELQVARIMDKSGRRAQMKRLLNSISLRLSQSTSLEASERKSLESTIAALESGR